MYQVNDYIAADPEKQILYCAPGDELRDKGVAGIPGAQFTCVGNSGRNVYALPWTDETCSRLNALGIEAITASPFWRDPHPLVEGRYTPMIHQLLTAAFVIQNPRCYVLSDCRLGKTASVIIAVDWMRQHGLFTGAALVITTLTTVKSVWESSIRSTLPMDSITILHGKQTKAQLKEPLPYWLLTNYDTVRLHRDDFARADIGLVVIDELTHVGNSLSQRSRAIRFLCNNHHVQRVIGITGTPGCDPEPVYGMVRTVTPERVPTSRGHWLAKTMEQYGPMPYMRRPIPACPAIIHDVMQPSIRFKKEKILNLPPVTIQDRDCALTSEQNKAVQEFEKTTMASLKDTKVTAANAAVLMSKLLQVPLGFVRTNEGETVEFKHEPRTQAIIDIIEETARKVVVFCMFRHRLKVLEKELNDAGISAKRIDGGVTGLDRGQILEDFTIAKDPRVLICHPLTVGFGTELSVADTMILDGPPMLGNFSYMQTIERLSSIKQKSSNICIIRLYATRSEKSLFRKLSEGKSATESVAELFEEMACEGASRKVHSREDETA